MNMLWWQMKANPMMPMAPGRPAMSKYFQFSSPLSVFSKIIFWVDSSLSVKSRMNTVKRMKSTKMILSELHFARRDMSLQVQLQQQNFVCWPDQHLIFSSLLNFSYL